MRVDDGYSRLPTSIAATGQVNSATRQGTEMPCRVTHSRLVGRVDTPYLAWPGSSSS